jgi:hypothetical protein
VDREVLADFFRQENEFNAMNQQKLIKKPMMMTALNQTLLNQQVPVVEEEITYIT